MHNLDSSCHLMQWVRIDCFIALMIWYSFQIVQSKVIVLVSVFLYLEHVFTLYIMYSLFNYAE